MSYRIRFKPDNKFIVKVVGGIGNQLFGLAFGIAVANKLNVKLVIDDSLIYFGSNKKRKIEVNKLRSLHGIVEFKKSWIGKLSRKFHCKLLRRIVWFVSNSRTYTESNVANMGFFFHKNQKITGYFQTWLYADMLAQKKISFELKLDDFILKNEIVRRIDFNHDLFIHVRLGDYLEHPDVYKIIPESYYLDVINTFESIEGSIRVVVFVEESEHLKDLYPKLFIRADVVVNNTCGLNDFQVLTVLSSGYKIIASNSTYSMWAAWFIKNKGGLAIVPERSYFPETSQDLIDNRWDKVDFLKSKILSGVNLALIDSSKLHLFESKFRDLGV